MKQPNLIFPHNAAVQRRYDWGLMEYFPPHNGNAFDSSVSELLNLRAPGASWALRAPKKSGLHRAPSLCVPLSAPLCTFLSNHEACTRPLATGLNYQRSSTVNLLCLATRGLFCLLLLPQGCSAVSERNNPRTE